MAKLFSGGYETNEREFNRGREDMSDLLTCIGLVMLLNGAVGAAKGSALGGNLQYAMAGGGTMDAAMAITAENAMVIAALNSMYPDTSNDGIIRRIEGDSDPKNLGDADIKDLDKLPKNKIKELGGENYTQGAKKNAGKSKADLYWDKEGNVYSVPKNGGPPQWIDWIPRN